MIRLMLGSLLSVAFAFCFVGAKGIADITFPAQQGAPTTVTEQSFMSFSMGLGGMGLSFAVGWWGGSKYTKMRMIQNILLDRAGLSELKADGDGDYTPGNIFKGKRS